MVGLPDEHIALVVVADSPSVVDALARALDAGRALARLGAVLDSAIAGPQHHLLPAIRAGLDDGRTGLADIRAGLGTIVALSLGPLALVGIDRLPARSTWRFG